MLSQHPQILIQYEDDTNLETVVNEISTIIQFFCVMIGNITGIDDIYLFYGDEKKPDKIYFNKDFSYNTKDCTPTYQHPTTFEDVSESLTKYFSNWYSFCQKSDFDFLRMMYFLENGNSKRYVEDIFVVYVKFLEGYFWRTSGEEEKAAQPAKEVGFLAVSVGDGLSELFKSLGVDYIIEGGQTMNPSTADILDAVDKVNAKTIFVLPNNKNIILAANQAAELMTDKELLVIPTKTIPQGITAVINFVPELSVEENEETMLREIKNVKTGQVTYAVRDTVIDDKEIKKDDFMGIGDQGIVAVGTDMVKVTRDMIAELVDEDSELISIYYGCDVAEDAAEALRADLEEAYPACDIELQYGGQPIYYYTVSVE